MTLTGMVPRWVDLIQMDLKAGLVGNRHGETSYRSWVTPEKTFSICYCEMTIDI